MRRLIVGASHITMAGVLAVAAAIPWHLHDGVIEFAVDAAGARGFFQGG